MQEYIILTQHKPIDKLIGTYTRVNSFDTYEEAEKYALTLSFGVVIYEAISQTKIKHEVTQLNENLNNSSGEQTTVARPGSKLTR